MQKEGKLRNEPVALLLVDQRMPQMTGVEFLEQAIELFPDARRVLLTAYADTDATIRAINQVKLDYYLRKPWEPPEELLYPVLQDLLDEWQASYHPPFEGIRLIGHQWSPNTYYIRNFLARNQVRYEWLDIETAEEARHLIAALGSDTPALPVLLFLDGSWLANPATNEVAQHLGLSTHAQMPFYDLIIVGGGPSGLAAAVYGASEGLHTLLIEREAPGGQAVMSSRIENYLGFPAGLSGADLARRAVMQAKRFGVEILSPQEVTSIRIQDPSRFVCLADGTTLACHALLLATGVSYRKLEVPGIDKLTGAGVYYGACISEAMFYRNQDVHLVGGANSAGQAALYFSRYARSTTMLMREASLTASMSQYLIDEIEATPTIKVLPHSYVVEVKGETNLESVTVANMVTGETQELPSAALFIFIGALPQTGWLADIVERDEDGYILSGPDLHRDGSRPHGWTLKRDPFLLETSVPGIFVAGDARHKSVKRVASAVGEGAISVRLIHEYLGGIF